MSDEMQKLLLNKAKQDEYISKMLNENTNLQSTVYFIEKLLMLYSYLSSHPNNQLLETNLNQKADELWNSSKHIENLNTTVTDLQHELNNQISINKRLAKSEIDLRSKIENSKSKMIKQDENIRLTAEENYALK